MFLDLINEYVYGLIKILGGAQSDALSSKGALERKKFQNHCSKQLLDIQTRSGLTDLLKVFWKSLQSGGGHIR